MEINMKKLTLMGALLLFFTSSCTSGLAPTQIPTETPPPPTSTLPPPTFTATPAVEPSRANTSYIVSDEFLQNPERGFSSEGDLDDLDFNEYYEDGVTLIYTTVMLDEYRESDIPQELLDQMNSYFDAMRSSGSGVKTILRFAYNDGPYPNPEPDASLEQILRHIEQVSPVLRTNADVIVWLEAGFVGAWGEWHASTNGLDKDQQAKLQIMTALLDAMPSDRSVLFRYPVDIMSVFPTPLTEEFAYSGSYQSRVGFHNDCFLASENDEKTYARDGVFTFGEELSYLGQTTQFVPVGGESCAPNPPRSDCPTALSEMSLLHFTELGDGWHPDVLASWEEQGCYAEIEDRMGYRLSLTESTMNTEASPGGILHLTVNLNNDGFAPPINPRPVYLVLSGVESFEILLPIEPRLWLSGNNSFEVKVRLPATLPTGEYNVSLWLPDPYETLQDNPRYAIAFANEGVWDASTGYNLLSTLKVNSDAGGNIDPTATDFEVIE